MSRQTNVIVKLQVEGNHQWTDCNIDEVSFLKNSHRHIFYITCKKQVNHLDRDIEIIMLKREILNYLSNSYIPMSGVINSCQFGNMSCEHIAEDLINEFDLNYCEVLEDNENGAEIIVKT